MHNMNELVGIIKGINFDGVINELEVQELRQWLDKNRNLACEPEQIELIKVVDNVLEDSIIDENERKLLLNYADSYLKKSQDDNQKIYELNGIIEGIVCDGEVNEKEIIRLKKWMESKGDYIKEHLPSRKLCNAIDAILKDGIVTEEEQEHMLDLLSERISNTQFETKLGYLCKQVKAKKNIGLDLIDLLYNQDAQNEIHERAIIQLELAMNSYTKAYTPNGEVIFVSLCLIGMLEYNGSFYDSVRETYKSLYKKYSQQKIECLIRTVLDRYRSEEEKINLRGAKSRIINVVLYNAIVPSYYLENFFEFIYDIYKMNFDYSIPKDLYEEFKFIYDGLRSNMLSDEDNIQDNVTKKTYKLISATKHLIADRNSTDSIIKLSIIVINLIDKKVWEKPVKVMNPYLKSGYEEWEKTIETNLTEVDKTRKTTKERWIPSYVLTGNDIYIIPPIHKIKAQYNYWDICVQVLSDGKVVYEDKSPDIRDIIAGYKVIPKEIKIDKPLKNISYRLIAGAKEIYNSKISLYRKYIIFNKDGEEIKNNTDYSGTAIICYDTDEKLQPYYKNADYFLASKSIRNNESIYIDGDIFNFTSLIKPGVFGDKYENVYLKRLDDNNKFDLYKEVKNVVFETNANAGSIEIAINDIIYKLSDMEKIVTNRAGVNKYVVKVDIKKSGIYSLVVREVSDDKKKKIANFHFAVDSEYKLEYERLDYEIFSYKVSNGILPSEIAGQLELGTFDENQIQFRYKGQKYTYILPIDLQAYRLSGKEWRPVNEDIWIGDLQNDTNIDIYDCEIDSISVYSNIGRPIENVVIKDKGVYKQANIGFLVNYKNEYDFTYLVFMHSGKVKKIIFCNNVCQLRPETEVIIDSATGILNINPWFYGKGNVCCKVINENNEIVFNQENIYNDMQIKVDNLISGEKYSVIFSEKAKGLALSKNKYREMKKYDRVFYDRKDYVGMEFRIIDACYKNDDKTEMCELPKSYVKITDQKSFDIFIGEVYMRDKDTVLRSNLVKPVVLEFCGDAIDGNIDVVIKCKDKYLTYDSQRKHVTNSLINSGQQITSYIISIE